MSQKGGRLGQGGDETPHLPLPRQLLLISSARPPLPPTIPQIIITPCYYSFKRSSFPPLQPTTVFPLVLALKVYWCSHDSTFSRDLSGYGWLFMLHLPDEACQRIAQNFPLPSPSPKCDLAERTTVLDLNGNYLSVWLKLPPLAPLSLKKMRLKCNQIYFNEGGLRKCIPWKRTLWATQVPHYKQNQVTLY